MATDKKKKSPLQSDIRAKTSPMDLKYYMAQTDLLCSHKLCELEHQKRTMSLFATFLMTWLFLEIHLCDVRH